MTQSPQLDSEGPVGLTILSNGQAVADSVRIHSVEVRRAVNVVPTARLVIDDGLMPTGDWPVANATTFAPGAEIVIKAGYGSATDIIFQGVVVKIGMKISGDNFSRLIIDCQDKVVKMTVGRRNANHIDQTDGDIIKSLALGAAAVQIGRPVLWGLAVAGEEGAGQVLELLRAEFELAMKLCGCRTLADITGDLIG